MVVAGIDYSMTSPAICVHTGSDWHIDNCKFYFQTGIGKMIMDNGTIRGSALKHHTSQEQRFYQNAGWAQDILSSHDPKLIALEGYAMGAKGLIFNIAENTGILKHLLWMSGYKFITPPPTVLKKFATGKGNSNKEAMQEAFIKETGWTNLKQTLGQKESMFNPSGDLIDAYFACKYAHTELLRKC